MKFKRTFTNSIKNASGLNKKVTDYTIGWCEDIFNKKKYTDTDALKILFINDVCTNFIVWNNSESYVTLSVFIATPDFVKKQDNLLLQTIESPKFKTYSKTALKFNNSYADYVVLFEQACYIEATLYLLVNEVKTGKNVWNKEIDFFGRFNNEMAASYAVYNFKSEMIKLYFIKVIFAELAKRTKYQYLDELINYKINAVITNLKENCNDEKLLQALFQNDNITIEILEQLNANNIEDFICDSTNNTKQMNIYIKKHFKSCVLDNMSMFFNALNRF